MKKGVFILLVLIGVLGSHVNAATDFFYTELTGAGDVLTDGTLVTAVNCGYAAANGDVTVNGLAFTAGGTETEGGTDDYSQVGGTGVRALGWSVGTIFTGDAGTTDVFDNLFNSIAWQTGAVVAGNTLTLHLSGLAAGEDYRLQLFYGESRPAQGAHRFDVTVQGATSDIYSVGLPARGGMSPAIRVDCYFTATASDVDVVLTAQPEGVATSGVSFSAYALHAGVTTPRNLKAGLIAPEGDWVDPETTQLEWSAPIAYVPVGYDLVFRKATEETEPNFLAADNIIEITDQSATSPYPVTLEDETTYYWRVDAYEPNSLGDPPTYQPIRHEGFIWSFTTASYKPEFTTQPADVLCGEKVGVTEVTLEVAAASADGYQWYKDDQELNGETGTTLTLTNVTQGDEGVYTCVASNDSFSTTSDAAIVEYAREKLHLDFEGDVADGYGYATSWQGDMSPAYVTGDYPVLGQAIDLDVVGDPNSGIDVDPNAMSATGLGVSLSFWTKHEGDIRKTTVCEGRIDDNVAIGTHVPWSDGNVYFDAGYGNGNDSRIYTPVDYSGLQDTWNHFVFTKDAVAGVMKMYRNGALIYSGTGKTATIAQAASLLIGTDAAGNGMNGLLDDFRLYNYAISAEEVAALYEAPTGISTCLYPPALDIANGSTGLVQGDEGFEGDCVVDLHDFAAIADSWLISGFYPVQ